MEGEREEEEEKEKEEEEKEEEVVVAAEVEAYSMCVTGVPVVTHWRQWNRLASSIHV
jgi:hypothetical protein